MIDFTGEFPRGPLNELLDAYAGSHPGFEVAGYPYDHDLAGYYAYLVRTAPAAVYSPAWAEPITSPGHQYGAYIYGGTRAGVVIRSDVGSDFRLVAVATWPAQERG